MSGKVVSLVGTRELPRNAPRTVKTTMEPRIVDQETAASWQMPRFQRPLKVNDKVIGIAEELKRNGGIMTGVITLGEIEQRGKVITYLVDGQHRRKGFEISKLAEVYMDLRIIRFETMADMAKEFARLNSRLVGMAPDDILRALEESSEALTYIRRHCPFVGYGNVRRGPTSPILSMSLVLRSWFRSAPDVPVSGGNSATVLGEIVTMEDAEKIVQFLNVAIAAWGRDVEYQRLWGALNMCICLWIWRRVVLGTHANTRTVRISVELFTKCMMGLSADRLYLDFLVGRMLNDRDRGPAYERIKTIFKRRIAEETGNSKAQFPQPAWGSR